MLLYHVGRFHLQALAVTFQTGPINLIAGDGVQVFPFSLMDCDDWLSLYQ